MKATKPLRSSYPTTHLLNPAFRFVPWGQVRETIQREKERLAAEQKQKEQRQ